MEAVMQELQEQIGFSAGQIYDYLNSNGESSFSKMKKELDLKGNFADLGLGWFWKINLYEYCWCIRYCYIWGI